MLLLRVLGLVIVVPKLCCLPCPRRNGVDAVPDPDVGVPGDIGCCCCCWKLALVGLEVALGEVAPLAMALSMAAEIPFADGAIFPSSLGVAGLER